ncbi:unnamed protein product, partial [Rotaria sp. Silwood2]
MSTAVANIIKLRFRYWNCRGLLEKAADSWLTRKFDERISGPFHNLPVLHWNDTHIFGQTLTIGQFLAQKFNLYGKLTSSINDKDLLHGYIDGVVSCAYTDVIINILQSIWTMIDFVDETNPMNLL